MKPLHATDPSTVGDFALLGRLGAGGMGDVYLGVTRSGRPVAVKVIRAAIAADPAFRARFVREVAAARQVGGFWTASVVAADADAESPWLATEYVPGPSLQQAVRETGPLPVAAVRVVAARLAEALAAIHAAGLVHRDLKPANVLLAPDGPKVIDFGIARAFQTETAGMTAVIGTPSYMSPEQIKGEPLSPASDVFSLASTLVYALLGRGPFNNGPPEGVIFRVAMAEPDLAGVPAELSGLVTRCLEKEPAGRPTTDQLLAELLAGGSAPRVPPGLLGPAAAGVVAAYGGWRPPVHDPAAALAHPATEYTAEPAPPAAPVPAPPVPAPVRASASVPPPALVPSPLAARYLFPDERLRGEWRQHRFRLGQYLAAGAAGLTLVALLAGYSIAYLGGGWFTAIPVLVGVLVLGWTAWAAASWHARRLVLTDRRVIAFHGPITRHVAIVALPRVTGVRYEQPPLGRILRYGTLVLDFAGEDQELREVPYLPDPNEIYLRCVAERYEPA